MSRFAARQSPLGTMAQTLPRLRSVLGNLKPTWHMRSLDRLDAAFIHRHEIEGILWDVDGTLTRFHDTVLAPEALPFRALTTVATLQHAILSNAGEERFRELGRIFPEIPIVKGYLVDGVVAIRRLERGHDSWTTVEVANRLAAGAVPLRKPDGALIRAVLQELGLDPRASVMVGDQYLTDIAGANLGGIRSIKLPAIGPETLPPGIRIGQWIERMLYRLLHGRPAWDDLDLADPVSEE
jgi:predicted HAD superfamily phosphohydrolase YqeG